MTSEDRVPEPESGSVDADAPGGSPLDDEELDVGPEELEALDEVVEALVVASPLETAIAERDEYLEALRRLQAEFDNYRKRVLRQQTDHLAHASEALLERLLPVLDAFDLAIAHASTSSNEDPGDLTGAFVRIDALLRDVLAKEGLERIDTAGVDFDPTVHDAVAHVARDDEGGGDEAPSPTGPVVDHVLRAGYRLKGRVLRPAMVRVRG